MGRMAAYTGLIVTWEDALNSQVDTFPAKLTWDMSLKVGPTPIPGQAKLAKALTDASFADVVFFTNSGTEAIEVAIKTARKHHWAKGHPERIDIIGFDGSFHGRSLGAINSALEALLSRAFAVAKRVRTETAIGSSSVSIASVAVELAEKIFGSLICSIMQVPVHRKLHLIRKILRGETRR